MSIVRYIYDQSGIAKTWSNHICLNKNERSGLVGYFSWTNMLCLYMIILMTNQSNFLYRWPAIRGLQYYDSLNCQIWAWRVLFCITQGVAAWEKTSHPNLKFLAVVLHFSHGCIAYAVTPTFLTIFFFWVSGGVSRCTLDPFNFCISISKIKKFLLPSKTKTKSAKTTLYYYCLRSYQLGFAHAGSHCVCQRCWSVQINEARALVNYYYIRAKSTHELH